MIKRGVKVGGYVVRASYFGFYHTLNVAKFIFSDIFYKFILAYIFLFVNPPSLFINAKNT